MEDHGTSKPASIWAGENWLVIMLFTVLTLVGVVVSTGILELGLVAGPSEIPENSVRVPLYVYLYASLGALGYIFTTLMTNLEQYDDQTEFDRLAQLALRIPGAWVLGAGTYLLSAALLPPSSPNTARFAAGFAFLVGLYVNVAMKSLGSLADRLLGRGSRP